LLSALIRETYTRISTAMSSVIKRRGKISSLHKIFVDIEFGHIFTICERIVKILLVGKKQGIKFLKYEMDSK
jgi:hypothetical protein